VLIGSYGNLSYWKFVVAVGPAALAGTIVNVALLWLYAYLGLFRKDPNLGDRKRNPIDYDDYDDSDDEKQTASESTWLKEEARGTQSTRRVSLLASRSVCVCAAL
jgi:hypothetical protein